jgi:hypothetical protein
MIGVDRLPSISELTTQLSIGDVAADWQGLQEDVRAAQRTGQTRVRRLALPDSNRRLMARIDTADAQIYPQGAAVLWLYDLTEIVLDLEKLEGESRSARNGPMKAGARSNDWSQPRSRGSAASSVPLISRWATSASAVSQSMSRN